MPELSTYFHVDTLSYVLITLISFVSICVGAFSWRYLKGDAAQARFFRTLGLLVAAVLVLVTADHILVFLAAWGASNFLLVRLMVHKQCWEAARQSGNLALKNLGLGFLVLAVAFAMLYAQTGLTSIQEILKQDQPAGQLTIVLALISIAAMAQSALWPFHRWLTSSLNSPTPVSAVMHAGLINGGGFLLARFAPLYFSMPLMLTVLFIVGIATAFLGTLWKLMQNDVKRMLACSTMGQMGFMVMQCGLGLFPAAIAHLFWHGLFKAYLFLATGSAARDKRLDLGYPPSVTTFLLSILCGVIGTSTFVVASHRDIWAGDTTLFLTGMAFMAVTQLAMPIIGGQQWKRLPLAACITALSGAMYGLSVHWFELLFSSSELMQPQPLTALHIIGFSLFAIAWLAVVFGRLSAHTAPPQWALRFYVLMLNASQPHPKTITSHRNSYQYK